MDQPISPTSPVFTQTPVVPDPPKNPIRKLIKRLILALTLLAILLFTPVPYYQAEAAICKMGQTCPGIGWYFNPPLYKSIIFFVKHSRYDSSSSRVILLSSPAIIPMPSVDPTGNWKIYTSTNYGYSIKYPSGWYLYEPKNSPTTVGFWVNKTEGGSSGVWVFIQENPNKLPVEDWWKTAVADQSPTNEYANTVKKTITVDNSKGLFVQSGQNWISKPFTSVYIAKEDKIIHINTNFVTGDEGYKYFDQILSTFKFSAQESVNQEAAKGQFCGGFAGKQCPADFACQLEGNYPDAGGVCVSKTSQGVGMITEKEVQQGWYWGMVDQKKLGMPADWMFTEAGRSSCWHKLEVKCINN